MTQHWRKLLGTVFILVFMTVYALMAMALAQSRVQALPGIFQAVVYMILGLAWVLPLLPLVKWMQLPNEKRGKPDHTDISL